MDLPRTVFDPGNYEGLSRLAHIEKYLALTYQQQSATLTANQANSWSASTVFDLGQAVAVASLTETVTAFTAGGETFGDAAGNVRGNTFIGNAGRNTSDDGVSYLASDPFSIEFNHSTSSGTGTCKAVNDKFVELGVIGRFLRVTVEIWTVTAPAKYAGSNTPSMTWAISLEY